MDKEIYLSDIRVDQARLDRDKRRFDYVLPNFLEKFLLGKRKICSIGCGVGYDVDYLCGKGYDVSGFDPGGQTLVWDHERRPEIRSRLKVATAEDFPFGKEAFDFAYAFEVIEHVGTTDNVWRLAKDSDTIRTNFLEACLDTVVPGGELLLTTSNRLCPYDPGHGHHYHPVTDFVVKRTGIRLSVPWHKKNFVPSFGDMVRWLEGTRYKGRLEIRAMSTHRYPQFSAGRNQSFVKKILDAYLWIINGIPGLRTSPLNPLLIVYVRKKLTE
jgi:SAM-dependent methyltransferase